MNQNSRSSKQAEARALAAVAAWALATIAAPVVCAQLAPAATATAVETTTEREPSAIFAFDPTAPMPVDAEVTTHEGFRLVWSEEFNGEGTPDRSDWRFEEGFLRNRELQWYSQDNASIAGGRLLIQAERVDLPNPRRGMGERNWQRERERVEYTSSSLTTQGHHHWQYGRFEIRAKVDARDGLWPAIWTLGIQSEWPRNGEVDIMEFYRGKILANGVWARVDNEWEPQWDTVQFPVAELAEAQGLTEAQWVARYHVWRMDWDENMIRLYVDDRLLNEIPITDAQHTDRSGPHPFRQPHYLLLNLAIGGDAGGDPSDTEFPALFEVDYVRIYQVDDSP